jgi:hypothetical protein
MLKPSKYILRRELVSCSVTDVSVEAKITAIMEASVGVSTFRRNLPPQSSMCVCGLIERYLRFGGTCCLRLQVGSSVLKTGTKKFFRNVGIYWLDRTASNSVGLLGPVFSAVDVSDTLRSAYRSFSALLSLAPYLFVVCPLPLWSRTKRHPLRPLFKFYPYFYTPNFAAKPRFRVEVR